MPSASVDRVLHVKRVSYRGRAGKAIQRDIGTLDDLVRGIFAKSQTIGDRHVPKPQALEAGVDCVCFDHFLDHDLLGVTLDVLTYRHGYTPDQVAPNLAAPHLAISTDPIVGPDGVSRTVASVFSVHVLGETLIAEYVQGSGGLAAFARALQILGKKADNRLVDVKLHNVPSRSIHAMIKAHGGVSEATVRMSRRLAPVDSIGKFAPTLRAALDSVRSATSVETRWRAETGSLDVSDVVDLWDNADEVGGWEIVSLKFGDQTTQSELDSYAERARVRVQAVRDGAPARNEIRGELVRYLERLMKVQDGFRIVDERGFFVSV